MDAGTGTKKELYRQALSAGEEGSLRGGTARLDSRCLFPDERRLENDDLIGIAQNCATTASSNQPAAPVLMRLPKYKAETVADPAQPFDALYFIDTMKPATLI